MPDKWFGHPFLDDLVAKISVLRFNNTSDDCRLKYGFAS